MITKKDLNNLESLFLLSAIDFYKGKRKASQALGTSVDTINKYVASLESELGIRMLLNTGRGSILTPSARLLLENANQIKDILNNIYTSMPNKEDAKGVVNIGFSEMAAATLSVYDAGAFFDQYPDLQIINHISMDEIKFSNTGVDIVISYDKPEGNDVVLVSSINLSWGFFASPEYLVRYGYPLNEEDMLANYRIIMRNGDQNNPVMKLLYKRAACLTLSTNSSFSVLHMVENNMGIGLLPSVFKDRGLVRLNNIRCDESSTLYLSVYRKTKDLPRVRILLNHYKELFESLV